MKNIPEIGHLAKNKFHLVKIEIYEVIRLKPSEQFHLVNAEKGAEKGVTSLFLHFLQSINPFTP